MLAEGKTNHRHNHDDDRLFNEELTGWKERKPIRRHDMSTGCRRKRWKERKIDEYWIEEMDQDNG